MAIDPFGREIGSMNDTAADQRVLVTQLPNQRVFTIYSVVGELFGWLMVASMAFIILWAIIRGRKSQVEGASNASN